MYTFHFVLAFVQDGSSSTLDYRTEGERKGVTTCSGIKIKEYKKTVNGKSSHGVVAKIYVEINSL